MKYNFFLLLLFSISFSQESFMVFFDSDQFQLNTTQKSNLMSWLKDHPKDKVIAIEGYTDTDGSVAYNDTLAKRRVEHVWELIKDHIVVRDDFRTRSYGKLHEQDKDKSKNRRVTITYLLEKDLDKENEILKIATSEPTIKKPSQTKPKTVFPDMYAAVGPRGEEELLELNQEFMQQLNLAEPGTAIIAEGLNFHFNTFAITKESRPKLYELLTVMQINKDIKIEIRGHMCCNPKQSPDKLSGERAKAVKMFLVQHGIANNRVTFKGMGTSQPLYQIPEETEEQRAANRRVEVFVVDNN